MTKTLLGASAFVAFWVSVAAADGTAAETKFNAGLEHFKAQDYATACPEFEESERLDANPSTEYFLAKCAIQHQRYAQAWNLFKRAAGGIPDPKARAAAEQGASDLSAQVGLITLVGTHPAANLEVRLDEEVVTSQVLMGAPIAVEPGAHVLRATAPSRNEWKREFTIAKGESLNFSVPDLPSVTTTLAPPDIGPTAVPPGPATTVPAVVTPPSVSSTDSDASAPSKTRRKLVYVGLGVGGAGVVAGVVFGVLARGQWADARKGCTEQNGTFVGCPSGADDLRKSAQTKANVSTLSFAVGGAGLALAAILYFTSHDNRAPVTSSAVRVVPTSTTESFGLGVAGRF